MATELRAENCPAGYTPRVFSPTGRVMFGTWEGPQDRYWTYGGRYGFMGGGTYTGKTDILRWYPWQQVDHDNQRIKRGEIVESFGQALYLLRETPRLREVLNRCERDFETACPDLGWKAQEKTYVWPNGYRMTFGHMQHPEDWAKYQGWQITCLLWDELPSFMLSQWDMMDQWVRQPAGSDLVPIHRAGGNPIGVGRVWVKKFFVDFGDGKEITRSVPVEVEDPGGAKRKVVVERSRMFVYAKVSDNKSVDQAAYLASFDGKPKALVRAMRDGDFSAALGDLVGLIWDEEIHVCKPYKIPSSRVKFRSIFFSYAVTTAKWFAVDYDGNMTCYRELRLENHTAEMAAERVRELEEEADEWFGVDERGEGSKLAGMLGPAACWPVAGQRGPSDAETFRKAGLMCRQADENIRGAANQIRTRLLNRTLKKGAPKEDPGIPGLRYFDTCTGSLESVPSMPASKDDPDMPDKDVEASAYKCLCYAVMSRPVVPVKEKARDEDWEDAPKPRAKSGARSAYPGGW